MVKISPSRANDVLSRPGPEIRAFLLYGPDRGLARERLEALTLQIVEDPDDPFRIVTMTGADLAEDPPRLSDEVAAISLGGGQRVIRLTDATDAAAGPLSDFLANPLGDARVVVMADNLTPRSDLRKLMERSDNAAAIACYTDEGRGLRGVIEETLARDGLRVEGNALAFLERALGGDRLATRRELEKLALYVGSQDKTTVSPEDAIACVGDSAALSIDDLTVAAGGGDVRMVTRLTARLLAEGVAPVTILRAAGRYFQRLHWLAARPDAGESISQAVEKARPPIFFKYRRPIAAQAGKWSESGLRRVIGQLDEAERLCKRTGYPDETLCARALLSIAAQAARL